MFRMISDKIAYWYDMWNTIVIAIKFFNGNKFICALMLIVSNHHVIKCDSNLL